MIAFFLFHDYAKFYFQFYATTAYFCKQVMLRNILDYSQWTFFYLHFYVNCLYCTKALSKNVFPCFSYSIFFHKTSVHTLICKLQNELTPFIILWYKSIWNIILFSVHFEACICTLQSVHNIIYLKTYVFSRIVYSSLHSKIV